ncbi:hypothetical protein [Mycobacteroides abscessus]|uniref:hypothetical protein n=1 Tax=Mycobacteroides abscessus TaxID=36809 RepID=UPI001878D208|nr:hypothetical protein [Mycobacteroides abscessus]
MTWGSGESRGPADPAKRIKNTLAAYVPTVLTGASAGLELPAAWTPAKPVFVLISDDGGGGFETVYTDPIIRVVAFGNSRDPLRNLMTRCAAHLRVNRPEGIARLQGSMTVRDGRDEDTGALLASFVVKAITRTVKTA